MSDLRDLVSLEPSDPEFDSRGGSPGPGEKKPEEKKPEEEKKEAAAENTPSFGPGFRSPAAAEAAEKASSFSPGPRGRGAAGASENVPSFGSGPGRRGAAGEPASFSTFTPKWEEESVVKEKPLESGNAPGGKPPPGRPEFKPLTPPEEPARNRATLPLAAALTLLFAIGGGLSWFYLGGKSEETEDLNLPTVEAEPGPVKVRPESPGGMEIPNRGKLVYNSMRGKDTEPAVERLLPMPEEPGTPPSLPDAPEVAAKLLPPPPALPAIAVGTPSDQKPKVSASPIKPPAPTSPAPTFKAPLISEKPPKPASKPASKPAPKVMAVRSGAPAVASSAKTYEVQLVAVRTSAAAEGEWTRLSGKHGDLLGGLSPAVMRADLGAKGVFYRLRAGPLDDVDAARRLCAELKKRKVGCMIIRPGR